LRTAQPLDVSVIWEHEADKGLGGSPSPVSKSSVCQFNWEKILGVTNEKPEVVPACLASSLSLLVAQSQYYTGKQKSLWN